MSQSAESHIYKFFVDAKPYETPHRYRSGQQIKQQASIADNFQLFLEEEGDTPDKPVRDDETLDLEGKEKHFFAVPPATFGISWISTNS
jgi:hypothetical protein